MDRDVISYAPHHASRPVVSPTFQTNKALKVANTSTSIVWEDRSFIDTKRALDHCAGALELQYHVKLVRLRTGNVVMHRQSSNSIPTRIQATYILHVRFTNLIMKDKEVLELLEALNR